MGGTQLAEASRVCGARHAASVRFVTAALTHARLCGLRPAPCAADHVGECRLLAGFIVVALLTQAAAPTWPADSAST
jgi:hypothetical protein